MRAPRDESRPARPPRRNDLPESEPSAEQPVRHAAPVRPLAQLRQDSDATRQPRFERRPYRQDDDGPPVGFTDHIPSFLLRPVKLKKEADAD